MKDTIYFIITIDTECDKGKNWQVRHPLSFESVLKGIPEILQPLFEKYFIKPTYLLSPEVILDNACISMFNSLSSDFELGTHLHGEFIAPYKLSNPTITSDFQCYYPEQIEREKLKNLTEIFKEKFGYNPKSFRAGRFGASSRTIKILEKLEYLVDSSVTPYTKWSDQKGEVDFLNAPVFPYFPFYDDITKPGNSRILEVPVTIFPRFLNPKFGEYFSFLKKRRITKRIYKRFFGTIWLRPTWFSVSEMIYLIHKVYRFNKLNEFNKPIVLNMMFHSVEVIPDASPYNKILEDIQFFLKKLERIFIFLKKIGAESVTLKELYSIIQ